MFALIAVILIGVMLIVGCGQKSSGGSGGQKQEKKVIDAGGAS